mgnify:FL=1
MAHDTHASQAHSTSHGTARTAWHATLHCATGCVAGEITGLAIGVSLGWPVAATIALAVALAFLFGLTLAAVPLARARGITVAAALRMVWLGEVASIATMEVAMNATDLALGGAGTGTVFAARFWLALAVAIPVGIAAAFPVNYLMIRRGLGHAHHGHDGR